MSSPGGLSSHSVARPWYGPGVSDGRVLAAQTWSRKCRWCRRIIQRQLIGRDLVDGGCDLVDGGTADSRFEV